jgi:hypothetical protein
MSHRFTRQELYDLVWSEPMQKLAPQYRISDVALAKACRRADIPVPERGYWAQLQAGKTVTRRPLPLRGLGMSDGVSIGDNRYETHEQRVSRILTEPIPPPPIFPEDLPQVTERVRKLVGKVARPHRSHRLHPLVARLLDEDQRRREEREKASFPRLSHEPLFDTPADQRRLRLTNAIFLAAQRCGATPWVRDREGRDIGVEVGHQKVPFTVSQIGERRRPSPPSPGAPRKSGRERLRLAIGSPESSSGGKSWEDSIDSRLEDRLTDIVVQLLVTGEVNYRAGAIESHKWWLQLRAQIEAEERRKKEEQERRERERLEKLEKERVEHLLKEAENWRRASDLRAFVEIVRKETEPSGANVKERLEQWATWVLALADRIDPIRSGRIPNEDLKDVHHGSRGSQYA